MKEERRIIFDPLKHETILKRIKIEFGLFCFFHGLDNKYACRCLPVFQKVCAGEPITVGQLQELLDEMYHPLLRPLKMKLNQFDKTGF